jgi:hypothetical protein
VSLIQIFMVGEILPLLFNPNPHSLTSTVGNSNFRGWLNLNCRGWHHMFQCCSKRSSIQVGGADIIGRIVEAGRDFEWLRGVEFCWIHGTNMEPTWLWIGTGTRLGRIVLLEQGKMMVHVVDIRLGPRVHFLWAEFAVSGTGDKCD